VLAHGDELAAVANHRAKTASAFAERHGIPRVTTDWESLAADPSIEAAIVATPNALHARQSIALLRHGKHVMVEKPMAITVAACDEMIAASQEGGAFLMVAHCWRFRDEVVAMRDRIASGAFGEVVKTRGYGVHANWGPAGWFTDPALAGGGALLDMGVHAIDTARFLLGDPSPERVCAAVGTSYADGRYTVDDDGILLIGWSNGTKSLVESGWWQPHAGGLEADTEVYGTKGYARIWPPEPRSDGYEHCTQPMYTAQVAEFLDAIGAGRQPRPSGGDGRVVLQVVEDAYRTAAGWP
jgi:predicted dehydrogenase